MAADLTTLAKDLFIASRRTDERTDLDCVRACLADYRVRVQDDLGALDNLNILARAERWMEAVDQALNSAEGR